MPLSEDEQRILHEIERRFYEHDPALAKSIGTTTVYKAAGRNCKRAALGFVIGLVILVVSFASAWIVGAIGFAVMLLSAIVFTQNLRKMGRAGWREMTSQMRSRNLGEIVQGASTRLRDRFRRDG